MDSTGPAESLNPGSIAAWAAVIDALGSPAAIVDADGVVLASNRPAEFVAGSRISQRTQPNPTEGTAPEHTWDVRSITDDGNYRLAVTAPSDPAEMLMQQFFFLADRLFVVYDTRGKILQANKAWRELLEYDLDELFSLSSWDLLPPSDQTTRDTVERELREQGASSPVYQMRTASGSYRTVRWSLQYDQLNNRCYGIGRDITDELRATRDLTRLAFTDDLTGLANRPALLEELGLWLNGPFTPALLFCDLDGFKRINDSLGHKSGDVLLSELGGRLQTTVSGPDTVVARFGGDEFVILLGAATSERATVVADDILAALNEPFPIAGHDIHLSMSIGIGIAEDAVAQGRGEHAAEVLLEHADVAAYEAKRSGANRYVLYHDRSNVAERNRFHLERDLRTAIEQDEIEVHYQPIRTLLDGECCGAEAIPFWRRHDGSTVDYGTLAAIADESGLVSELSARISQTAFSDVAGLPADQSSFTVSVPVAGRELALAGFPVKVLAEIADARLDPTQVLIQISASAALETSDVLPQLLALRDAGMRIALDDYASGSAPLHRLSELPIEVVRIDQNMVADAADPETSRELAHAIIKTFTAMGAEVILKGATTAEDRDEGHRAGARKEQASNATDALTIDELHDLLAHEHETGAPKAA